MRSSKSPTFRPHACGLLQTDVCPDLRVEQEVNAALSRCPDQVLAQVGRLHENHAVGDARKVDKEVAKGQWWG